MSVNASVIIPAWNGSRFIDDCLRSLRQHTPQAELIVVDNGSRDGTADLARARADRVIANDSNRGFSAAINQGVAAAQGEILLLLNQDTVALTDWQAQASALFDADASIGVLGFVLLYPDGTVQHAGARLTMPFLDAEHLTKHDPAAALDFVTGAAMAIRRAAWEEIGGFDEGFSPAYYEDVDYCFRARRAGWQLQMSARPAFTHFESQSRSEAVEQVARINVPRLRFALKHFGALWLEDVLMRGEMLRLLNASDRDWLRGIQIAYERAMAQAPEACAAGAALTGLELRQAGGQNPVAQAVENLLQLRKMSLARRLTIERVWEAA